MPSPLLDILWCRPVGGKEVASVGCRLSLPECDRHNEAGVCTVDSRECRGVDDDLTPVLNVCVRSRS